VRVAAKVVIIVAPVDTPDNNRAEELVLSHRSCSFLSEHREFGLVDFDLLEERLRRFREEGGIRRYERFDLDNLLSWVVLMLEDHAPLSKVYQEAYFLENRFSPRRRSLVVEK
jgi:hypothetical protein